MENESEDQVALISQLYPADNLYNAVAPQLVQGNEEESKQCRRKKRKRKASDCEAKKRKLSLEQAKLLEINFKNEHKLEAERKDRLALELGLDSRQVAVWFQNRRVRWKNKNLEEEVSKLRGDKKNLELEKCQLQIEVSSLKDQLNNAKKDIQRLKESLSSSSTVENSTINSPSSSLTVDYHAHVIEPQPLGVHFNLGGCLENMFCMPSCDYVAVTDWVEYFN